MGCVVGCVECQGQLFNHLGDPSGTEGGVKDVAHWIVRSLVAQWNRRGKRNA